MLKLTKFPTPFRGGVHILLHRPCHEEAHSTQSSCTASELVWKLFELGWKQNRICFADVLRWKFHLFLSEPGLGAPVPIYYVPWSRTGRKRTPPEEPPPRLIKFWGWFFRGGPLPPSSWSVNTVNRETPRGGGLLSINFFRRAKLFRRDHLDYLKIEAKSGNVAVLEIRFRDWTSKTWSTIDPAIVVVVVVFLLIELNPRAKNVSRPWRQPQRQYKSELRPTKHESPHPH